MSNCNGIQSVSTQRQAKRLNLFIEQGTTFIIPIVYKEEDVVVDLSGADVRSQFREKINSQQPLIDLSLGSGLELDGPEGKITMTILPEQTESLKIYHGVWDMMITFADGNKFRILKGEWDLDRMVTR